MTLRAIVTDIERHHHRHPLRPTGCCSPTLPNGSKGFIRQHGDEAEVAALLDQVREEIRQRRPRLPHWSTPCNSGSNSI
jgi:hypothetical protein